MCKITLLWFLDSFDIKLVPKVDMLLNRETETLK